MLERLGEPLGVVTAINGQSHATVAFIGEAGHAGTVPMDMRRDALQAAAEWVLAVEGTGTVGRLDVEPGARNVIPGEVIMTLDVRDPDDDARHAAIARLRAAAEDIAARRDVQLEWIDGTDMAAVALDEYLGGLVGRRAAAQRRRPRRRDAGARRPRHDAVRALPRRHQPQPRRVGRGGRRRRGHRRARAFLRAV